jgi:hypothetical protein
VTSIPAPVRPPPATIAAPDGFTSLIVPSLPPLLREFGSRTFRLLWRGSRDGFGAADFHRCCCGSKFTLTIVRDTDGNIFGGFTPLSRERSTNPDPKKTQMAYDHTRKSFLFTLVNPHNLPPTKFPMRIDAGNGAILYNNNNGPYFRNLILRDNCNTRPGNIAQFAMENLQDLYLNHTGVGGDTVFTGSRNFTVSEVEVFCIANYPEPPPPPPPPPPPKQRVRLYFGPCAGGRKPVAGQDGLWKFDGEYLRPHAHGRRIWPNDGGTWLFDDVPLKGYGSCCIQPCMQDGYAGRTGNLTWHFDGKKLWRTNRRDKPDGNWEWTGRYLLVYRGGKPIRPNEDGSWKFGDGYIRPHVGGRRVGATQTGSWQFSGTDCPTGVVLCCFIAILETL